MSLCRQFVRTVTTASHYSPALGTFSHKSRKKDQATQGDVFGLLEVPPATFDVQPVYISTSSASAQLKNSRLMNIPPAEDPLLHYLASSIMRNGNRARASRIVSRTLLYIHAYTGGAPALPILRQALFSLAPLVRTMNHKQSTKMIYKPIPLSEKQGMRQAVHWLLDSVREQRQTGDKLEERLAREIIDIIVNPENSNLRKRLNLHEQAMINRGSVVGRDRYS